MLYIGAAIKNSAFHAEMEKAKPEADLTLANGDPSTLNILLDLLWA